MKLLFLTSYFYPESAASNYIGENIREALAENQVSMVLFAPEPSRGVSNDIRKAYRKKAHEELYGGRLSVHRFRLIKEGKNPVLRAMRYFLCCIKQLNRALLSSYARDCSIIFSSSTPPIQGTVAALIRKIKKIPFVYNLQDIFPDSLVGTGLAKKGGFLWRIGRLVENFTYRNADRIIVISEDFKKNIMAKGVPEEKIVIIYNWVDQNAVLSVPRSENKLFDKYGLERDKFYICYSGNIGLTQNMDMLLATMEELQSEAPDVHLVLVGEGAYKEEVVQKIVGIKGDDGAIRGTLLPNVVMLPFQPYEDISYVFSLGDAGLVISKPGVGANSVPSKTWSIMSASRPVLANFDENELKEIIDSNECGIFTKAGDKDAFKESVLTLYRDRTLCNEYGRNGRQFVIENLTRETGTQKYVDVIKEFDKDAKA